MKTMNNEAFERAKSAYGTGAYDDATMEFIFPQLAESEERIRTEIIDFIQWAEDRGMTRHDYHQAKRPAVWIAYLEKQKEQKPEVKDPFSNANFVRGYESGYADAKREQKSAEWSEEDELMIKCCLRAIEHYKYTGERNVFRPSQFNIDGYLTSPEKVQTWLESLRNRVGKEFLQPHWKPSEDEERLIKTSISFLKDFADKGYENAVECIDWLKSKLNGNSGK